MALKSKRRATDDPSIPPHNSELSETNVLFQVYRDSELGFDEALLHEAAAPDQNQSDPIADPDCESDDELVARDQQRCFEDYAWAAYECEKIGSLQLQEVILRNPDIMDRCKKPELFNRFGTLKTEVMALQLPTCYYSYLPSECIPLFERMSLS